MTTSQVALADIHRPVLGVERKVGRPLPLLLRVDLLDIVVAPVLVRQPTSSFLVCHPVVFTHTMVARILNICTFAKC